MNNPSWRIVTIGNLPRSNSDRSKHHACTVTLIETENRRILVDPGLPCIEDLITVLEHRTGYRPDEIDTVFLTHFHPNHRQCLSRFPKSAWLMSRVEIRWWQKHAQTSEVDRDLLARMVPIEEHALNGIEILPTPGHTHGSTSLLFETREGVIIIAGDAVQSFDHFDLREPSPNAEDAKEARRSIGLIAKMADVVVPGHDNYFIV